MTETQNPAWTVSFPRFTRAGIDHLKTIKSHGNSGDLTWQPESKTWLVQSHGGSDAAHCKNVLDYLASRYDAIITSA